MSSQGSNHETPDEALRKSKPRSGGSRPFKVEWGWLRRGELRWTTYGSYKTRERRDQALADLTKKGGSFQYRVKDPD
jgi:hypothetical protein